MAFNMTTQECQELEQRILNLLDENIILIATESNYLMNDGYYRDNKLPEVKNIRQGIIKAIELDRKIITKMWGLERAEHSDLDENKEFIKSILKENEHGAYFYITNTRDSTVDIKKLTHSSIKTLGNYTIEDKGYTDGDWRVVLNKNGDINKIGVNTGCSNQYSSWLDGPKTGYYSFWVEDLKIQDFTKIRNQAFETVYIIERHMQELEKKIQKTVLQIKQLQRFFEAKAKAVLGVQPLIELRGKGSRLLIKINDNNSSSGKIECNRGIEILSNRKMQEDVIANMCTIHLSMDRLKEDMERAGDTYVFFHHIT